MSIPRIAWLPWGTLALGAAGVLYGMIGFWVRGYDNFDRALIFLASAWLVHHHWPRLSRIHDTPRPLLGMALALLGGLAYLPPWFVLTQIGPRPVILWWLALALLIATVGVILMRSGPNLLRAVRFMLIFPLFALPLPGQVQNPLHEIMQAISADIGAWLIPLFGVTILDKNANQILLASGGIHVAEVCSGLYMIRTTLSLAALIGHLYGFTAFRSLLLILFAIPVIIFVNALRVTAFGVLQEWGFQDWVVPGTKHEIVGYIAYIPGLLLVIVMSKWLMPGQAAAEPDAAGEPAQPSPGATRVAGFGLAAVALAAVGMLAAPGVSRTLDQPPPLANLPTQLGTWQRLGDADEEIDLEVTTKLTFNAALNRHYTTESKTEFLSLWVLYWKSAMTVKDYHHPDICFVNAGDRIVRKSQIEIVTPGGRTIPLSFRQFTNKRGDKMIVYWTQEGRRLWTPEHEARAASFLFPIHWMWERFGGGRPEGELDDRLVVLMGMPVGQGAFAEAQKATLLKLAGLVADEVYSLCPWADPK